MQGTKFTVTVHLHGTLAANARGEFKLPWPASLEAVSFSNSAAADGTIDVGTSADRDGIIDGKDVGDSGSPALLTTADFNGVLASAGNPYHLDKDTIVTWDVDFDGAAGTASANAMIVFFFSEG